MRIHRLFLILIFITQPQIIQEFPSLCESFEVSSFLFIKTVCFQFGQTDLLPGAMLSYRLMLYNILKIHICKRQAHISVFLFR